MGLSLGEEGQEPGAGARPGRSRDGRAQTDRAGRSREDAARRGGPQCGPSITCARTLRRAPSCTAAPSPPQPSHALPLDPAQPTPPTSLRLFSALKLNRAFAKVQVPAACSPLHIPLAIDYRGASPYPSLWSGLPLIL